MTDKIPVGSTIARAYGFAFGNIVNNLGAIWVPVAITYALIFYYQKPYMAAMANMATGDPGSIMAAMPFVYGAAAVLGVLSIAQLAAISKEALGLRTGSAFLQFPFGGGMWRLLAAYFLFGIVLVVIYFLFVVGLIVFGLVSRSIGGSIPVGAASLIALALALFLVAAILYISVRLSFFLPPVAVAEKSVSLIRAWQLAQGNFWRILAIVLALAIPVVILECAYLYFMYGKDIFPPLHATPEQMQAFSRHQQEISRQAMETSQRNWYIYYPVGLVVALVVYGMFAGASAFAYRALVPGEGPPVPEDVTV
jgi:hypothetical protein